MRLKITYIIAIAAIACFCACTQTENGQKIETFKGLYSFGPDSRSLKDCDNNREYWVTDQSGKLELEYSKMNVEKPYVPVYVEVKAVKIKSGKEGMGAELDSTLVIKKLIKITKEIPQDMCN